MLGAAVGTHLHQELLRSNRMSCGTEGQQCLRTSETDSPAAAYPEECKDLQDHPYGLTKAVIQQHHLQEPVVSDREPSPYSGSPPSSWAHRTPPCMPRLVMSSALAKLPPEITVTPPTPTLMCPQGTVAKETRLKLKGMAPPLRLTGGESLDGGGQPGQEPLQQSDAAHGCEEDQETQMDI